MTPEEFEQAMKKIFEKEINPMYGDTEQEHYDADLLMCKVLVDLGYDRGVEWFKKMNKWYA